MGLLAAARCCGPALSSRSRRAPTRAGRRVRAGAARAAAAKPGTAAPADYETRFPPKKAPRRSGVVLHPTSLPSPYGIGEIGGAEARGFADWLQKAGCQLWQVLPLVPPGRPVPGVREDYWSPYSSSDANAGNVLMVSLDDLVADGLLEASELPPTVPVADCDFDAVAAVKEPLLVVAARRLLSGDAKFAALKEELDAFVERSAWLEDSAVFATIDGSADLLGKNWWEWPVELRDREPAALEKWAEEHAAELAEFRCLQFFFDRQFRALREYCNARGVLLVGDMPIYVGAHSVDVWANRSLFEVAADGLPANVSGVPPDAFSETGQLWGSPLYDWPAHAKEGYRWWSSRIARALELHDEVRIDHFRGFAGYWAVPGDSKTAMTGSWLVGPGIDFFEGVRKNIGDFAIVAEDLGVITDDVVALREGIDAPGMAVLQFAWGGPGENPHLLHNHYENEFVYPATHDNETTVGWFRDSATEDEKEKIYDYLGTDGSDIAWDFMALAFSSVARSAVVCMQDVLSLDNSARMNTPGVAAGNWAWRLGPLGVLDELEDEALRMRRMNDVYNRLPEGAADEEAEEEAEEPKPAAVSSA